MKKDSVTLSDFGFAKNCRNPTTYGSGFELRYIRKDMMWWC